MGLVGQLMGCLGTTIMPYHIMPAPVTEWSMNPWRLRLCHACSLLVVKDGKSFLGLIAEQVRAALSGPRQAFAQSMGGPSLVDLMLATHTRLLRTAMQVCLKTCTLMGTHTHACAGQAHARNLWCACGLHPHGLLLHQCRHPGVPAGGRAC